MAGARSRSSRKQQAKGCFLNDFLLVTLIAAVVAAITYLSGIAAERFKVAQPVLDSALQFAAGLIFALVVISLMPRVIYEGPLKGVLLAFFLGGAVFVVFEYVTSRRLAGRADESRPGSIGFYFGVLLDLFIDSAVIGIGAALTIQTGLILAIGITLHSAPLAFVTIAKAKAQGLSDQYRQRLALLIVVCILAGAILGYTLLRNQPDQVLLVLIGAASGFLITAVTQSMIPAASRQGEPTLAPLFFVLGLSVYTLVALTGG